MRTALAFTVLLSVSIATRVEAGPWSLGDDCRPEDQAKYDRFEQQVRAAKPGSTLYVPKPYPKIDREVVFDFVDQYKGLHRERMDPRSLPDGEQALLNGILNSTVTFSVQRVENWTASRCGKEQRRDYFNLLRVLDASSGAELARVSLNASGLWSVKSNSAPPWAKSASSLSRDELPAPETAMRRVAQEYRVRGSDPQYVTTMGTIRCASIIPCLAFHQGDASFLFVQGKFFQIAPEGPRLLNGRDVGTLETSSRVVAALHGDEQLVSLGGATWTIAREVAPPVQRVLRE